MNLTMWDLFWLAFMFAIVGWGIKVQSDRVEEKTYCEMGFMLRVQKTAYITGYEKGYTEGLEKGKVSTVYLCRDWIPLKGYKAWRQCNIGYLKYTGEQDNAEY